MTRKVDRSVDCTAARDRQQRLKERSSGSANWHIGAGNGHTMDWPEDCYGEPGRFYRFGAGPRVGTRNVHAMSGRVV